MTVIDLPARYYRHFPDPGDPNTESARKHETGTLPLPAAETALVLVDCWNDQESDSWLERAVPIMEDRILPVLETARKQDLTVVHCPSPGVASEYPRWTKFADDENLGLVRGAAEIEPGSEWPPASFRDREGEYTAFAKTEDRRARDARFPDGWPPWDGIYEPLEPKPRPDEFVIANGDQFHRLLSYREILHLVYVGFNDNVCLQHRDYGMRSMRDRGYNVVLLRDCTCAIESHDTVEDELRHEVAIREIEEYVGWTATSEAFRDALNE